MGTFDRPLDSLRAKLVGALSGAAAGACSAFQINLSWWGCIMVAIEPAALTLRQENQRELGRFSVALQPSQTRLESAPYWTKSIHRGPTSASVI